MVGVMVMVVIGLWIISPWIFLWAVNTLFHTSFAITTTWEWLAGLLLSGPLMYRGK